MSEKQYKPKICISCNETKTTNFFKRGQPICKDCENDGVIYDKLCKNCDNYKPSNTFRVNRKNCTDCERAFGREYRKNTTKAAEWVENNREKMSKLQHTHYETNKSKIREAEANRLKTDPFFRKIKSYRSTICSLLHNETQFNKQLNISRDNYVKWMSFRFENNMSIDNYVEIWQVDHVLPLNMIKTKNIDNIEISEDLSSLFLWFNTMPVLCAHNMKKNKYLDKEQLSNHIVMIDEFINENTHISTKELSAYKDIVQKILSA